MPVGRCQVYRCRDEHNVLSCLFINKALGLLNWLNCYTNKHDLSFGCQNKKNVFRFGLWTVFFSSQHRQFFQESSVFVWFISKRAASNKNAALDFFQKKCYRAGTSIRDRRLSSLVGKPLVVFYVIYMQKTLISWRVVVLNN